MDAAFLFAVLTAALQGAAGELGKQFVAEVRKRFSHRSDAALILDKYQQKPDVWAAPLRDALEELRISEDPDVAALADQVAQRAKISQSAIGHTVVQAGGDIGTVAGRDINVYASTGPGSGLTSLGVEVPGVPTHQSVYEETASYLGNVLGSEPGVGVAVDFGQSARLFESDEQDHLRTVAAQILGIRGGDERQDDRFAEIDTTLGDDDRTRVLVQFRAEGSAYIRAFLSGQAMPWDWVLVHGYLVTRCLYSESIRRVFGGTSQGEVTLGVTWPPEGISPRSRHLGLIQATPPTTPPSWRGAKHPWTSDFKADPWPMVRELGVMALSRAGYRRHEKRIREMDIGKILESWFPPEHPLRDALQRNPL